VLDEVVRLRELLLLATADQHLVALAASGWSMALLLACLLAWRSHPRDAVQLVERDQALAPLDQPDPLDEMWPSVRRVTAGQHQTLPSGVAGPGREPTGGVR
jgi:hypothetical protein